MSEFFVSLSSIEDVRQFVNAATCCPCEVDAVSYTHLTLPTICSV